MAAAITPPSAAPNTRAMFMATELSVTAFGRSSAGTISEMKLCRAGLSKTLTKPSATASRKTIQSRMRACRRDGEDRREQAGERLGDEQHPPLVQPVGEHAAQRAEQEHRPEPGRGGQAELGAAVGEVKHEEGLRNRLHPGPGHRDQLAEEEQPVVARRSEETICRGRNNRRRTAETGDAGAHGHPIVDLLVALTKLPPAPAGKPSRRGRDRGRLPPCSRGGNRPR